MKKELEIRQLLDYKEYHLYTSTKFELNEKITTWKLFKKYDGWIGDGSKPIMTSETHTEEELLEFAKKHKEYKLVDFLKMFLIVPIFTLIMCVVNLFVSSNFMSGLIWGLNIATFLICIIARFISKQNEKVWDLEFKEYLERVLGEDKKK